MFNLIKPAYAAPVPLSTIFPFGNLSSIGEFIGFFVGTLMSIIGLLILFYFFYAGWKYLISGGNKEELAKARAMVTHAIIGAIMLLGLFLLMYVLPQFLGI